jgi:hypothetical protein
MSRERVEKWLPLTPTKRFALPTDLAKSGPLQQGLSLRIRGSIWNKEICLIKNCLFALSIYDIQLYLNGTSMIIPDISKFYKLHMLINLDFFLSFESIE